MHHRPRADLDAIADADAAYHHGACADEAIVADGGRLLADFTDGDVLVNPAIGAQNGVAGDVHAVEAVGEGGLAGNFGAGAQVPAVAPRRAIQEKGHNVPKKLASDALPPPVEPPEPPEIVSLGPVHQDLPKVHGLTSRW